MSIMKRATGFCVGLLFIILGVSFGSIALSACLSAKVDYLPVYTSLLEQERIGEALNLASWIKEQPNMPNSDIILASSEGVEEEYNSLLNKAKRIGRGFLTGEYQSKEDSTGALISDFLFIGDIRDLGKQAANKYNDEEVDLIIVALSTAGLASSLATFLPEPSSTTAGVTAETGLSLLKGLKKSRALTSKFSSAIFSASKSPKRLASIVSEVVTTSKLSPPGTIPNNIRNIENIDQLRSLNQGLKTEPRATTVILTTKRNIDFNELKQPKNQLIMMAKYGSSKLKWYSRPLKFIYSGNLYEFLSNFIYLSIIMLGASCLSIVLGFCKIRRVISPLQT